MRLAKVSMLKPMCIYFNLQVYAIDVRNHGESPHSSVHNSKAMSEDLRLFMEQRSHPNAACMGHSMGGRSMMYFARKYVSVAPYAQTELNVKQSFFHYHSPSWWNV